MSLKLNQIIFNAKDWQSLKKKLSALPNKDKGDVFELFTKYFLLSHPEYASALKQVWLFSELTTKQKQELNVPSNDQGIDLVAQTNSGDYWAIQCKYLDDENQRLSHDYISTFGNLAFAISGKFSFGLVCTTAERFSKAYTGQQSISFCTSEVWRGLTQEQFDNIRKLAAHKPASLKPYKPFPHQQRAIKNAVKHFIKDKESRGKLILPCGSGKSLTGFWMAEELKAKNIIVAVPSLALVKQTLNTWLREAVANKMNVEWICVCSDESIGKHDDVAVLVQDLGVPCVTDVDFISGWLKRKNGKTKVVFTTYQSGKVVAAASGKAKMTFDLGIMDEAHKTVGQTGKLFSHLLYDKNIRIRKRVFMTATERRYLGSSEEIASMDNPDIYGDTFEMLSFKEALDVKPPILSDYRIITMAIDRKEVQELIKKNAYVKPTKGSWNDNIEAHTLASMIALRKAMQRYPIKHAVSFHSSIARAKAFEESQVSLTKTIHDFKPIETFHVTGATPTSERSKTINAFARSPKALITNARCLTEGVDVPNIDCVLFADPKKSTIDIVQAVGRALRVSKGKKYGYVIIPVLSDRKNDEQVIDDESYSDLLLTLRALASNDERIIEYFRLKREKGMSKGKKPVGDELVEIYAENIDLEKLVDDVELKVWNRLAKLSWQPFKEAREYVHRYTLSSKDDWFRFTKSNDKPSDIPINPPKIYKDNGWISWGDWLGTNRIADQFKEYRRFEEARSFVINLKLEGESQWRKYLKNQLPDLPTKPDDIPAHPDRTYKANGWKGWGYWLGTGNIHKGNYLSIDAAKDFVKKLNLKSKSEWTDYVNGKFPNLEKLPTSIPKAPSISYKNKGWTGWGDWLGTGNKANQFRIYLPLEKARKLVRTLGLKNQREWNEYSNGKNERLGERPFGIPGNPARVYRNNGWKDWANWLGSTYKKNIAYRSFLEARKFVSSLGLKDYEEWRKYCKGELNSHHPKPKNIPSGPARIYKDTGWNGYGDWLGTGKISDRKKVFRPFVQAREFARKLGLKNLKEWQEYSSGRLKERLGERPIDIPTTPASAYKNKGWVSWGDWLGTDSLWDGYKEFLPFLKARKTVHKLKLKSVGDWGNYYRKVKPKNLPSKPYRTYKNSGWISWKDWLGVQELPSEVEFLPFDDAKIIVAKLKLKSNKEWREYSKTQRPNNIPANPDKVYLAKWKGWNDWLGKNDN